MSDVALYYPYVHPRDEAWLKQAILYWPMIERIVPGGYLKTDTETGRLLQQSNILTEREPGPAALTVGEPFGRFVEAHAEQLRGRFSIRHAEELDPQPGWNDAHFDLRFGWVHAQKIAEAVVDALCDARLAKRGYNEWIGMHPALSEVYMCALAGQMAAEGQNTPITDRAVHHVAAAGWTFDDLARALLPDTVLAPVTTSSGPPQAEDVVVALAVQSLALRDLQDVTIERIISLREAHGADFHRFRKRLDELAASLGELDAVNDPQALAHHVEVRYRETVLDDLHQLREVLREQRFDYVDAAAGLSVPPAGIAAGAIADVATVGVATGVMTALAFWKRRQSMRSRRATAMASSPTTWLLRVDQDLAPRDLAGRMRDLMRRFAG